MSKHTPDFDISVIARLAGLALTDSELAAAQKDINDMLSLADTLDAVEPFQPSADSSYENPCCTPEEVSPCRNDLLSSLNTVSPSGEKYSGERFFLAPDPTNTASSPSE